MKIYSNMISIPCRKVLYVAEYLGLPFELQEMDFRSGEMRTESYRMVHPASKVPALQDGDLTLFESAAICRYLLAKHANDLVPDDVSAQALVDQWCDFSVLHVGLAMGKVFFNTLIAPKFALPVDERSLSEGRAWLKRYLPILDEQLSQHTYLAGESLSLADFTLLPILERASEVDVDLTPYIHVVAWMQGMQAQSFWQKLQVKEQTE